VSAGVFELGVPASCEPGRVSPGGHGEGRLNGLAASPRGSPRRAAWYMIELTDLTLMRVRARVFVPVVLLLFYFRPSSGGPSILIAIAVKGLFYL
jgi:hypothetical protein